MSRLVIGMVGAGTVGGGIYEILRKKADHLKSIGVDATVSKICVRSLDKARDFEVAPGTTLTTDPRDILNDADINCVVEVMGGTGLAKDVVFDALRAGKHVVTANKALVATEMVPLLDILASNPKAGFGMEAAVCGGIPVINALQTDFSGDTITSVQGIMNGTTNFMLSKMEAEGADYGEVLAEAQALGFAEADPTADVEGHDVQAKISILAKLAFGATINVADVPVSGISKLGSLDFEYAASLNSTIKLIGTATQHPDTGAVSVFVAPTVVPNSHSLASVRGSMNAVVIGSENLSETSLKGHGAGRFPTANSCVNDIIRIAQGSGPPTFPKDGAVPVDSDYKASFYVRIKIRDQLGVIRRTGELAEQHNISIYSVLQNPITDPTDVDFVVTTDECAVSSIQAFCADLEAQDFVKVAPTLLVWMRE